MQSRVAFVYRVMVGNSWAPTAILDSFPSVESEFVSVESLVTDGGSTCMCLCPESRLRLKLEGDVSRS